jgi:hypothetical protein
MEGGVHHDEQMPSKDGRGIVDTLWVSTARSPAHDLSVYRCMRALKYCRQPLDLSVFRGVCVKVTEGGMPLALF